MGSVFKAVANPIGALVGGGHSSPPVQNTAGTNNAVTVNPTTNVTVDTTGIGNGMAASAQANSDAIQALAAGNVAQAQATQAAIGAVVANDQATLAKVSNQFSQTIDAFNNHLDQSSQVSVIIAIGTAALALMHARKR